MAIFGQHAEPGDSETVFYLGMFFSTIVAFGIALGREFVLSPLFFDTHFKRLSDTLADRSGKRYAFGHNESRFNPNKLVLALKAKRIKVSRIDDR